MKERYVCLGFNKIVCSLDVNDFEDVGLVRGVFVVAVDADYLVAALTEASFLGLLDNELKDVVDTDEGWDLKASDAADCLKGSDDLVVDASGEDWHWWPVLGDKAGDVTGVSHDDDEIDVKVENSADSRGCDCFGSADGLGCKVFHIQEEPFVVEGALSLAAAASHDRDGV